jgi:hypothetical protein
MRCVIALRMGGACPYAHVIGNPKETDMKPITPRHTLLAGALFAAIAHQGAQASCGSSFCMVNTNWNLQGFAPEPGVRLDLRYEYIKQDQPMSGSDRIGVGQISRHHDEIRTVNHNWLASLDYTIDPNWAISATLPVVDRNHSHIHNHHGEQEREAWNFTRLGDVRVVGRRQWVTENNEAGRVGYYGLNFGLKLPTGDRDVHNAAGERAERTLQPGTGTTDIILGGFYNAVLPFSGSSWFVQGLWQSALNSREDYKPGRRLTLDVGYRYELTDAIGLMLQVNALHRQRDSGSQAEPDDTGGRFLFLSPGVSVALSKTTQLYGFVQLPLYQHVNGVQLTADWSAVVGVSARF